MLSHDVKYDYKWSYQMHKVRNVKYRVRNVKYRAMHGVKFVFDK